MNSKHFDRIRQSGWYDIVVILFGIAIVFVVLGLIGLIQMNITTATFTEATTNYEKKAAMGFFANSSSIFFALAALLFVLAAFSLLYMRFISPVIMTSIHRQLFMRKARVVMQHAAASLITAVMLFPIYWMLISALKTSEELLRPVPTLWPENFQWGVNFAAVLQRAPFGKYFYNTLVSTLCIMVAQMLVGIFAAYGFSKGEAKGKNFFFIVVLGALMIPIQVTFVPIYVLISKLGWINTFPALIVPNLVSAYFIFMLRQSFMAVDNSYLEAGKLDGMGRIGAVFHILCPMCKPTLITVSIITFVNGWNSYFWPKMVTTNDSRRTIAVGVNYLRRTFAGVEVANYNEIMAGAVLAILPIVILFLFLQKYIMTGLSKAAMK